MLRELKVSVFSSPFRTNPLSYLALTMLLAFSGPFGTLTLGSFAYRLLFWSGIVCGAILIGRIGQHAVERWMTQRGPLVQDLVVVVIMTICMTPFLWGFVYLMGHDQLMLSLMGTAQYVAVVTAGLCVVRRSIPGFGSVEDADQPETPPKPEPPKPRLARRLPTDFQMPVLRLTIDDHVVEVIGISATERLRMRFADAIDEMEPIEGFCTHRSHWITRDAVVGVERDNGQLRVRLINGDLVPVSRKYRSNLDVLDLD